MSKAAHLDLSVPFGRKLLTWIRKGYLMSQDEALDNVIGELSLPTEMFNDGENELVAVLISQFVRRFYSKKPVNFNGFFTDIGGLVIYEGDIVLGKANDFRAEPKRSIWKTQIQSE